ncbi:hypothetical protein [Actinomycetospora straminea]|uniref:Uncharacterized protein n=1 Tax=Actinomycetospora straminea TaxID=663607 RepID=A0ABP9E8A8_9PSEU|nr:hypothetical protein [Actinomycetospora straminea]MDD7932745.1 hypothetical protein [Actinomycetospora straminea]
MTSDAATPPPAPTGDPEETPPRWEWHVEIPYIGPVGWPLTGSLSYLITVGALAAFEIIPWPVAGLLGLGHVMARNRDNQVVSEIGSGLKVVG